MIIRVLPQLNCRQHWIDFCRRETPYCFVDQPECLVDFQGTHLQITLLAQNTQGKDAIKYSLGSRRSVEPAWQLIRACNWDLTALVNGLEQMDFSSNVRDNSLDHIWNETFGFNHFRGYEWMKEPCLSCDEKEKDFGGCRCQAYMMTGDATNTDPVCSKSEHHHMITDAREAAENIVEEKELLFRNTANSRTFFRS